MLKLFVENKEIALKIFKFPAGESSVKIMDNPNRTITMADPYRLQIKIICNFESNDDIINLLLLTDAVRNFYILGSRISLTIPYFPYARQDRVCNIGESLSVKVIANLINSQNYEKVTIWDPHSDVTSALINNVASVNLSHIAHELKYIIKPENTILVSPDAGANKKVYEFAKTQGYNEVVRADKTRDIATGKITGTKVYWEDTSYLDPGTLTYTYKDFLIIDDIADGGYTFIKLAEELRKLTTGEIYLYVTHGLFTKGIQPLIDSGITKIFTRNLMNKTIEQNEFIEEI